LSTNGSLTAIAAKVLKATILNPWHILAMNSYFSESVDLFE
jgi:hypothetical protein